MNLYKYIYCLFDKQGHIEENGKCAWCGKKMEVAPPKPPELTEEMKLYGFEWALCVGGTFRPVCSTCGGNCGQCGVTNKLGNVPPSMDRLILKLHNQIPGGN